MHKLLCALITILLSGTFYYFAVGFHNIGWLMWLAPIPILVYAFKETFWKVAIVGFLVGLASGINVIVGYWPTAIPAMAFINSALLQSLQFVVVLLLTRYVVKRINNPLSILAYPVCLSLLEWGQSLTIQGTFNTIANSQLHILPVIQIAAITGYIGVTFIVSLFAACIAYLIAFPAKIINWIAAMLSILIVIMSVGYGYYRVTHYQYSQQPQIKVGLVNINTGLAALFKPDLAISLLNEYQPMIQSLSKQGAEYVLLPEESITVDSAHIAQVKAKLADLAKQNQITLIIGVNDIASGNRYNSVWIFNPAGEMIGEYSKRHLVPVLENGITPGTGLTTFTVDKYKAGTAVCRDMDYPYPAHAYGKADVGLLFVPAWDFDADANVHVMGAILRGIENGYTVVRTARDGLLTVTAKTGQFIGNTSAVSSVHSAALLANAPISTQTSFYALHSYWFVIALWLMLLLLVTLVIKNKLTHFK